jgi:hypothetical protein
MPPKLASHVQPSTKHETVKGGRHTWSSKFDSVTAPPGILGNFPKFLVVTAFGGFKKTRKAKEGG